MPKKAPEPPATTDLYEALAALGALLEHEGERETSGVGTEHDSAALEAAKEAARAVINKAKGA